MRPCRLWLLLCFLGIGIVLLVDSGWIVVWWCLYVDVVTDFWYSGYELLFVDPVSKVMKQMGLEDVAQRESPKLRVFTLDELRRSTRLFETSMLLGGREYGRVYKEWVQRKTYTPSRYDVGKTIAVKRLGPKRSLEHSKWEYPKHIQHLILVGTAGSKLRSTWKGAIINHLWESNLTPSKVIRGLGPWGPDLVRKYTTNRFGKCSAGDVLNEEESKLLTDYVYHTLAAKASGELSLKYIFSFGAFTRSSLLNSVSEWKVPISFIYGVYDWMNYEGAVEACKKMNVPCDIIRVPKGGHFVFVDNPFGFHSAVSYVCRRFFSTHPSNEIPEGLASI